MSIEKPVVGQPGWGLVLNAALDELDEKETIEGAEAKAAQAYSSATEYTDARINETVLVTDGEIAAIADSAAQSASSASSAKTSATAAAASAALAAQATAAPASFIRATNQTDMANPASQLSVDVTAKVSTAVTALGDPAFASIRDALEGGRSCAIYLDGDSTVDGSAGGKRLGELLADHVAAAYPSFRVETISRDGATEQLNAPVVVQEGPSGRRYVRVTERSLRYKEATPSQFTNTASVTITGAPTGGTFTLTAGGLTTPAIAYNAAAIDVENALKAITTAPVTVAGTAPYIVKSWLQPLTASGAGLLNTATITVTGAPTGGTFTLTTGGVTTSPIAYNATALVVETALKAITAGPVTVTGSGPYTVQSALVGITASGTGLTGGSTPGVSVSGGTTPAVTVAASAVTVMDLRMFCEPDSWRPATSGILIARTAKDVSGTVTADQQFTWRHNADGTLRIDWSRNGTSFDGAPVSTAAVPDGSGAMGLRAVFSQRAGTGGSVAFYTTPMDGARTWTQLGTTVAIGFPTNALWNASAGAFWEIGAKDWQPANNPFVGKIYEVDIRDGSNGTSLVPILPENWERYPNNKTTYGGSPTFRVIDVARAGQNLTYLGDATRIKGKTPDYGQSVLIFGDSHNEGSNSGQVAWLTPYAAWVDATLARTPNAAVVVIKQNPHTSAWANEAAYGHSHRIRLDELGRLAARRRWGVLDLYSAFLNDPRGLGVLINADGLHPSTPEGYALTGDELTRMVGGKVSAQVAPAAF